MTQSHRREILLVEDSPSDAILAQRAIEASSFDGCVRHARDGIEALAMLRREGRFVDCPRPALILLDLNMPRKDGRQVLQEIREDDNLRSIPVVMLTTSTDERDIADSYYLGSNSYIVKPVELQQFYDIVEQTQRYWFHICRLPSASQ